ncbi:MAG: XRE family transcriptional regulator [Acidobacteriota bacterium]|nr:XRE family transcriptional regulator [Acidobacteriota bacterium]
MPQDNLLDRLATNIRTLRRTRGITREQLAATAEVDPQMIKRIENGRANPALVTLSRLASALMISLSLMLSGEVKAETTLVTNSTAAEPFEADTVGETITSLRKNRQLSRRALARLADVRALTLSRYEAATTDARILAVEPIARALGITADDFIRAIELRQRQSERTRRGWHSPFAGVQCRLVTSGAQSQLWEWRLGPGATFAEEPPIGVSEEMATAIRGEVSVEAGEETFRLHRGGSALLPHAASRRFVNNGASTARLFRYQVTK